MKILRYLLTIILVLVAIYFGYVLGQQQSRYSVSTPNVNQRTGLVKTNSNTEKLNAIINLINRKYVDSISVDAIVEKAIPVIMGELDPHSAYIPVQDMNEVSEPLNGSFDGVGIVFNMTSDTIFVINTVVGGPSERAGVLAGDRIMRINDSLVAGRKIASDSIMKLLRGKSKTKVNISVKRGGYKNEIPFTITRDKIPLKSVDANYMIDKTTGYLKMSKFASTTLREFEDAMDKMVASGMKSVIIDLRENTGGYLNSAFGIANDFFADKELIVYTEGHASPRRDYFSKGKGKYADIKVAVLINEWSASASEILTGAIQDNDRGIVVGRRSYGKGLVMEPIMFSDGSGIHLTVARYYTPIGRCLQKPYKNGEIAAYREDILDRYIHKEFFEADSIHFNDSLKFTTPKGKIVYGGGGIMPDVFVPADTTVYKSAFINKSIQKNLIFKFTILFSDRNRDRLSKIKTLNEMKQFFNGSNIYSQYLSYAAQNGVTPAVGEPAITEKFVSTQLKALIARNSTLDDNGYYPIVADIDETLQKAIEVIEK